MSVELALWLRGQLEADLSRWRGLAAAYLPNAEREGEVLLSEAQERVADCEAKLAILVTHHGEVYEEDLGDGDYRVRTVCTRCDDGYYPCRTVRLLGLAYRYRPGYSKDWKP